MIKKSSKTLFETRLSFWKEWVKENLENPEKIAKMIADKERLADYDPLTKVLNRRGVKNQSLKIVNVLKRQKKGFVLLFVDLDNLKKVNDTKGHEEGDRLISGVAKALIRSSREADLVGRWGGDEFVVLLVDTDKDGALNVVERIYKNLPRGSSVSIGLALWDGKEKLFDMITKADKAMYEIKKEKKNKREKKVFLLS